MIRRVAPFAPGDIRELVPLAQQLADFGEDGMERSAQVLADAGTQVEAGAALIRLEEDAEAAA